MFRLILHFVLFLTATAASAWGPDAVLSDGTGCSARNYHFSDEPAFVREEVVESGQLASIKAVSENAPLKLIGGSGSGYGVKVCKAAASEALLDQVDVRLEGGVLTASGPEHGQWTAAFEITAPRGGRVELESGNGPVSVRDFDGTLTVRSQNGPLSLRNVDGEIDAVTTNGPISVKGGAGSMKLQATNGPLTVHLAGPSWNGTLDAKTSNGPVTLTLPGSYASGVVVETSGGPVSCRLAACDGLDRLEPDTLHRRWNEPRVIELGSGPTAVRLATKNGPVTIRSSE